MNLPKVNAGEELQRAIKVSRDARGACLHPAHDHDTYFLQDGTPVGEPVALLCWEPGCGQSMHFDKQYEKYFHDDLTVPACFIATGSNVANPCVSANEESEFPWTS